MLLRQAVAGFRSGPGTSKFSRIEPQAEHHQHRQSVRAADLRARRGVPVRLERGRHGGGRINKKGHAYTYPQPTLSTSASTPGSLFSGRGGSIVNRRVQMEFNTLPWSLEMRSSRSRRSPRNDGSRCQRGPGRGEPYLPDGAPARHRAAFDDGAHVGCCSGVAVGDVRDRGSSVLRTGAATQ